MIATDIDKQVIDTARMGLYNEKSIASVPDDLKKKYFYQVRHSYQISDEIKKRVEFKASMIFIKIRIQADAI